MPLDNPYWTPVKVAFRRMADVPDLQSFVTGGSYIQGVQLNTGDRFLLYDENAAGAVTGLVGNGIFVVDYGVENGWYRPSDADLVGDFETGKKVVVEDGDFAGTWTFTSTFPTLTFQRLAYWAGQSPSIVDTGIDDPAGDPPDVASPGVNPPAGIPPTVSVIGAVVPVTVTGSRVTVGSDPIYVSV